MNQVRKLQQLKSLSYFDKNTLAQIMDMNANSLSANTNRWLKQGVLIQLKKGMYVTEDYYIRLRDQDLYFEFIANKIREPSYISLEYVLQKYGILTEAVNAFTSITLKSRRRYQNIFGIFVYRNITEKLFTGYEIKHFGQYDIKEASKAKALFDYLYLKLYRIPVFTSELLQSFRLNLDEFTLNDRKEFTQYCHLTGMKKFFNLPILLMS